MTALTIPPQYTFEEYLEMERTAEYRSELVNGYIYAMAGASRMHNLITVNLAREVSAKLKGRPCEAYANDMRVKVEATGRVAYPDVVVVCGKPLFADDVKDTLLNPLVIVEVLSPSTEADDRGEKFAHYRRIDSLQEYVLIAQDRISVEHFQRQGDQWLLTEYTRPDSLLEMPSVDCRIPLSEIYDKVEFAAQGSSGGDPKSDQQA
jgi:Uma2 family endonuclease